jgi:hypothetical protein
MMLDAFALASGVHKKSATGEIAFCPCFYCLFGTLGYIYASLAVVSRGRCISRKL